MGWSGWATIDGRILPGLVGTHHFEIDVSNQIDIDFSVFDGGTSLAAGR